MLMQVQRRYACEALADGSEGRAAKIQQRQIFGRGKGGYSVRRKQAGGLIGKRPLAG